MTKFNVQDRTIMYIRHGSHAYGLNTPTSDEDFKGICIKPREYYLGFLNRFEQYEHMGSKSDGVDEVIYSIDKFAALAAECNPNIIEILFVDESDVLRIDEFGEELRSIREEFLSKKAKHTFSGYAHAQLHRMKSHRNWLIHPITVKPKREDFGLSESSKISKSEMGAYDQAVAEGHTIEMSKELVTLLTKEKQYQAAKLAYDKYEEWKKNRNPARSELEAKFGVDTKHAMHLCRLMRMCKEILATGKVNVKRTEDRDELLAIRHGEWSYDQIIEHAERLEIECEELYKTSGLRSQPNRVAIDARIVSLTERYLRKYG